MSRKSQYSAAAFFRPVAANRSISGEERLGQAVITLAFSDATTHYNFTKQFSPRQRDEARAFLLDRSPDGMLAHWCACGGVTLAMVQDQAQRVANNGWKL